jgi:hypothetical protein
MATPSLKQMVENNFMLACGVDACGLDDTYHQLYAIGDIHGDTKAMYRALCKTGLTDEYGTYKPTGDSDSRCVVIVGDVVDGKRGENHHVSDDNDDLVIILYLLRLQWTICSEKRGDRLQILAGNHELMNFQGDFSYSASMCVMHQDRKLVFSRGSQLARAYSMFIPLICIVNGVCFSHASLDYSELVKLKPTGCALVTEINRLWSDWLVSTDSKIDPVLKNLLWSRSHTALPEVGGGSKCETTVVNALRCLGARKMVCGHMTQKKIKSKCGGLVYLVDTAMSEAFGQGVRPPAVLKVD